MHVREVDVGRHELFGNARGNIFLHVSADIRVGFDRARFQPQRTRAVDARRFAGIHFDEHTRKALDIFQNFGAFFRAVHSHEFVAVDIVLERFDDAAADGIKFGAVGAAAAKFGQTGERRKVYVRGFEHGVQIFERKHAVHHAAVFRLFLFGDARPYKDDVRIGKALFEHFRVRDHGRIDGREIAKRLGIVQFDHAVDRRTAGSDKVFEFTAFEQFFILIRDFARADGSFFRVEKA